MISISNMFPSKELKEIVNKNTVGPSPSLNQGKKFKKYQNKIERILEKKDSSLNGKEGFINNNSLISKTNNVIDTNDYSRQQQTIDTLRQEYQNTLKEYEDLTAKFSGDVSGYVDRVSPNNPYLNKTIRFTTGQICYVTKQGVVKWIPSSEILNSINVPKTYIDVNIPWNDSYSTPGTSIPTTPPLISGTNVKMAQSFGNEGSNVFVDQLLPPISNIKYMGCFAANDNNDNMSFIGNKPPMLTNISIENGNFNQPIIEENTYQYLTGSTVPGWYFSGAALLNNSKAWGYPTPYPNGNQCVSIQRESYINTVATLNSGITYTLTFKACGRNCCMNPVESNPINIQLYTNLNAFISQIGNFTAPLSSWTSYTFTFTVPSSQTYKIYFTGTNPGDASTALQGISLSGSASESGTFSYESCKQAAITNGYRFFGLQNANASSGLGYCAVSNSEPSISQYGNAQVPSKMVALWSSNTAGQTGNTAILSNTGSLQVVNSSGQAVYASPAANVNPDNFLGCYQDCSKGRGLPTKIDGWNDYSSCRSAAESGGWSYFGLQYNQPDGKSECWVGNDKSQALSMGTAGNCKQLDNVTVGGSCSNAIYSVKPEGEYYLILQEDGNMCIYRGTSPNNNQGGIWCTMTNGQQQSPNPNVVATKGKYGKNWISSGSTLAPGDFLGSDDGKLALVMQTDGNLVLYTYQMETNCRKIGDKMGGGEGANAVYDIGMTAINSNMGKLAFIDSNSDLYTYPNENQTFSQNYRIIKGVDTIGNDIPGGAFANATVDSCRTACSNNPECAGFVTNGDGTMCWPKTNAIFPFGGPSSINADRNIYVRSKQPTSPPVGVTTNTDNIDTITYQNYLNSGKNVGSQYGLANATSAEKQQLEQLQSRMNLISKQLTDLTNKFQIGSSMAEQQSENNVSGMYNYLKDLKKTNVKMIGVAQNSAEGVQNILNDSDIVVLQKNYDYLFWTILAAGTVLVSMNIIKK